MPLSFRPPAIPFRRTLARLHPGGRFAGGIARMPALRPVTDRLGSAGARQALTMGATVVAVAAAAFVVMPGGGQPAVSIPASAPVSMSAQARPAATPALPVAARAPTDLGVTGVAALSGPASPGPTLSGALSGAAVASTGGADARPMASNMPDVATATPTPTHPSGSQAMPGSASAPAPAPEVGTAPPCPRILSARARPGAMVEIELTAPCDANAGVQVAHAGLVFDARLTPRGTFRATVPAMDDPAAFELRLNGDAPLAASADVPDLSGWDRVALQWTGRAGLQIHALEGGAGYDDPGHIWAQAPSAPGKGGGFLTRLGRGTDAGAHMAEVYSAPVGAAGPKTAIRLSVEAPVTPYTCGRDITGRALRPAGQGRAAQWRRIRLAMPGCDAVGDILVLNNPFDDLKLALN